MITDTISWVYWIALVYIGIYPILGAVVWMLTAWNYYIRREKYSLPFDEEYSPSVSIIVSARNEEILLAELLDSLLNIDYPNYEIIIIDDGSIDHTAKILKQYQEKSDIRVLTKVMSEGKAIACNDAIMCSNGEILLILDADIAVEPDILRQMIPHFLRSRVAAVAGNPRVRNVNNFLTRMQLLEYTAVIGMLRRSHRIWGRIMAVSGVVFAIRKCAFFDVGGFTPAAATEDIDLTWKLQLRYWDVHYESKAIVWVDVPRTYKDFFNQRLRWARGLMFVIHTYYKRILTWKSRRMWPVFFENILSTIWAIDFIFMALLWVVTSIFSSTTYGVSLFPHVWGVVISSLTILLCVEGMILDRARDPTIWRYFLYSVYYPIYYWILLSIIAVIGVPSLFKKPKVSSTWISPKR